MTSCLKPNQTENILTSIKPKANDIRPFELTEPEANDAEPLMYQQPKVKRQDLYAADFEKNPLMAAARALEEHKRTAVYNANLNDQQIEKLLRTLWRGEPIQVDGEILKLNSAQLKNAKDLLGILEIQRNAGSKIPGIVFKKDYEDITFRYTIFIGRKTYPRREFILTQEGIMMRDYGDRYVISDSIIPAGPEIGKDTLVQIVHSLNKALEDIHERADAIKQGKVDTVSVEHKHASNESLPQEDRINKILGDVQWVKPLESIEDLRTAQLEKLNRDHVKYYFQDLWRRFKHGTEVLVQGLAASAIAGVTVGTLSLTGSSLAPDVIWALAGISTLINLPLVATIRASLRKERSEIKNCGHVLRDSDLASHHHNRRWNEQNS